jgi:hypothetical protein
MLRGSELSIARLGQGSVTGLWGENDEHSCFLTGSCCMQGIVEGGFRTPVTPWGL